MRKSKQQESGAPSRWVVDDVAVLISGKRSLQDCLNKGEQAGWDLVTICPSGGNANSVLVVWERSQDENEEAPRGVSGI